MRYFVDHRQQRVDDMSRAGSKGEAIGYQGGDNGDLLGVLADDPLRNADKESIPPATSIADAAMITVSTISSTSPGMFAGATLKPTTSTSKPKAPHKPSPTPPIRAPIARAPAMTTNSKISLQSVATDRKGCSNPTLH
jgi:hypothetical protein